MPRLRALATAALAAAASLPATGCGSEQKPVRAQEGRLEIVLDDFLLDPQRVRARPGRVTFRAVNRGRLGHTLRVRRGERDVLSIATLRPGEEGQAAADLKRGDYELLCVLANHARVGMHGTLAVR